MRQSLDQVKTNITTTGPEAGVETEIRLHTTTTDQLPMDTLSPAATEGAQT